LLARLGARVEAEAVLRIALSLDHEAREALLWLGAIVSDPKESLDLIGRAYTIDPMDRRAQAGLAWARARLASAADDDSRAGATSRPSEEPAAHPTERRVAGSASATPASPAPEDLADRVDDLLRRARRALATGDLVETILAADEAARLDPRSLEALALLGVSYYREGRLLDAERVYRRMLAIQPDHAEAHANLGVLAAESGRKDDAERFYRRALEIDPTLDEVRLALADVLIERGKVDDAVAEWRAAADRNPAVIEFHVKIAEAFELAQRFDEAAAAYGHVVDRHGNDPSLRLRLGRVLHASGRMGAALEQFREACRSSEATAECFVELAAALLDIGRLDEAVEALNRALSLAPDDPLALELLARIQPPSRRAGPDTPPQIIGPTRGILERLRQR
jgi:tetratricopeptide (TPR) repeat protein